LYLFFEIDSRMGGAGDGVGSESSTMHNNMQQNNNNNNNNNTQSGPNENEKSGDEKPKDLVDPWDNFDTHHAAFIGAPPFFDKRIPYDGHDFKVSHFYFP